MVRNDLGHATFMLDRNCGYRHLNYYIYSLRDDFGGGINVDWVGCISVGLRLDHVVSAHCRHHLGGLPRDVHVV